MIPVEGMKYLYTNPHSSVCNWIVQYKNGMFQCVHWTEKAIKKFTEWKGMRVSIQYSEYTYLYPLKPLPVNYNKELQGFIPRKNKI